MGAPLFFFLSTLCRSLKILQPQSFQVKFPPDKGGIQERERHMRVTDFVLFYFCFGFWFLGPHPWPMEVPGLGVQSELQLPTNTTATATQDQAESATYTTGHSNAGSLTH